MNRALLTGNFLLLPLDATFYSLFQAEACLHTSTSSCNLHRCTHTYLCINTYTHMHIIYVYIAVYMYFSLFLMALLSDFRRFALNVIIATFYRHINTSIIVKFVIKKNEIASN